MRTASHTADDTASNQIVGLLGIIYSKMSDTKDKIVDARSIWVPISVVFTVGAALIIAGMWIQQTNDSRSDTQVMADKLDSLMSQQATMQGSLNALMEMQSTLSKTSAEVGSMGNQLSDILAEIKSLKSRSDAFETRLQTQDAWIQSTRQKMIEQGFKPPEFKPIKP